MMYCLLRIEYSSLCMHSLRSVGDVRGEVQNFNPNPSRFFVPLGGCVVVHRLCTARLVGCNCRIARLFVCV